MMEATNAFAVPFGGDVTGTTVMRMSFDLHSYEHDDDSRWTLPRPSLFASPLAAYTQTPDVSEPRMAATNEAVRRVMSRILGVDLTPEQTKDLARRYAAAEEE